MSNYWRSSWSLTKRFAVEKLFIESSLAVISGVIALILGGDGLIAIVTAIGAPIVLLCFIFIYYTIQAPVRCRLEAFHDENHIPDITLVEVIKYLLIDAGLESREIVRQRLNAAAKDGRLRVWARKQDIVGTIKGGYHTDYTLVETEIMKAHNIELPWVPYSQQGIHPNLTEVGEVLDSMMAVGESNAGRIGEDYTSPMFRRIEVETLWPRKPKK